MTLSSRIYSSRPQTLLHLHVSINISSLIGWEKWHFSSVSATFLESSNPILTLSFAYPFYIFSTTIIIFPTVQLSTLLCLLAFSFRVLPPGATSIIVLLSFLSPLHDLSFHSCERTPRWRRRGLTLVQDPTWSCSSFSFVKPPSFLYVFWLWTYWACCTTPLSIHFCSTVHDSFRGDGCFTLSWIHYTGMRMKASKVLGQEWCVATLCSLKA